MVQSIQNVNSKLEKQFDKNYKKIQRRRYITLNDFERIKSVLLKNKVYITKSKVAIKTVKDKYFLYDEDNDRPCLDLHHSSLSICTSQDKKNIWHFDEKIENEIETLYHEKKISQNIRERNKHHEVLNESLFVSKQFKSLSETEIKNQLNRSSDLIITPHIRPLLSEIQIYDIQEAQKECQDKNGFEVILRDQAHQEENNLLRTKLGSSDEGSLTVSLKPINRQKQVDKTLGYQQKIVEKHDEIIAFDKKAAKEAKEATEKEKYKHENEKQKKSKTRVSGVKEKTHKLKEKNEEVKKADKSKPKKEKNKEGVLKDKQNFARKKENVKEKDLNEKVDNVISATETVKQKNNKKTTDLSATKSGENIEKKSDKEKVEQKATASESKLSGKTKEPKGKSEETIGNKSIKSIKKTTSSTEEIIKATDLKESKSSVTKQKSENQYLLSSQTPSDKKRSKEVKDMVKDTANSKATSKVTSRASSNTRVSMIKKGSSAVGSRKSRTDLYAIYYQLSDQKFITLGWTLEPRDTEFSHFVTFQARAAHPLIYAFRDRELAEKTFYQDGKLAFSFEQDSTGKVLYNSGHPAMIFTQNFLGRRVTLYSEPTNDIILGHKNSQILGAFDSYGNGVVYNNSGAIRLNYDQAEGIFYESWSKSPMKWQWSDYEVIQEQRKLTKLKSTCTEETNSQPKAKPAAKHFAKTSDFLEELPLSNPPVVELKTKKKDKEMNPIILKLSNEMTLRIKGQDNIVLSFDSMGKRLRLDLGVIIEPDMEVRVDEMEVENKIENVPCVFEALQIKTPSLVKIAKELHMLRYNKMQTQPKKQISFKNVRFQKKTLLPS